ncbi:hypothetical protein K438DRAFT_1884078 [Mycena galopus ATCC 62051]|nr:hypothetical protein K438DRAFT_1884078 [Mycena galopus ATCC 62051]
MPRPPPHARAPKWTPGDFERPRTYPTPAEVNTGNVEPQRSYPIPAEIDTFYRKTKPDASPEERQAFFDMVVRVFGSYRTAVENLKRSAANWDSGATLGPPMPPASADLTPVFGVGPFTIFYHSGIPQNMQEGILNGAPFFWNFYIANGPNESSIMTDWETRNITVHVMAHTLTWEPCTLLSVSPSARVRISWPSGRNGERLTRELIFPPDPNAPQERIPVMRL